MTERAQNPAVRRAARALALTPAVLVTILTATAHAVAPAQWEDNPSVSPLHVILLLVVVPVTLFVLITLLVYLPSMSKGQSYRPGEAWRGESTWFGGPRDGVGAVDATPAQVAVGAGDPGSERGGARGSW